MQDRVEILLATFNGEKFLQSQLDSISFQSYNNWHVWARDDGSSDNTLEILMNWANKVGSDRIKILYGPKKGFVANFQFLLSNKNLDGKFIAFCDQDDIWMNKKLERAISQLSKINTDTPAIYCSRTQLIEANGAIKGSMSPLFVKSPSFSNAIVQSIAGGNTMVLNKSAQKLMAQYSHLNPVSHDWWAYQLVTGISGIVIYDSNPSIYYRQHGGNIIGENNTFTARYKRFKFLMSGGFYSWNSINISCLESASQSLTDDNNNLIREFKSIRSTKFLKRLYLAFNNSFYRQTIFGNIALIIALILKKL